MEYNKLKGRIIEKGFTARSLAKALGISEGSFYLKLKNQTEFRRDEIELICRRLEIPLDAIGDYFFSKEG